MQLFDFKSKAGMYLDSLETLPNKLCTLSYSSAAAVTVH